MTPDACWKLLLFFLMIVVWIFPSYPCFRAISTRIRTIIHTRFTNYKQGVIFYEKGIAMSLSQSYRQDLLDAIQLAEQGMLSPSQQAYCFEEIEDTKGTAFYPANGDELFRSCALRWAKKRKFPNASAWEPSCTSWGWTLFHTYIDRFTFSEITHTQTIIIWCHYLPWWVKQSTRISAPTPQRCGVWCGWRKAVIRRTPPP